MSAEHAIKLGPMHRCCTCGIAYAFDGYIDDQRHKDGGNFYCPNGHSQVYRKPRVKELEEALERERSRSEQRLQVERKRTEWAREAARKADSRARAYKGHLTRTKRRVAHGVCPCCNRTFGNLSRHMRTQHPDYVDEDETP